MEQPTVINCGNSTIVKINSRKFRLNERDVRRVWYQTAKLYDTDHFGPAPVDIGPISMEVSEPQWQALYQRTDEILDITLWDEIEKFEESRKTIN